MSDNGHPSPLSPEESTLCIFRESRVVALPRLLMKVETPVKVPPGMLGKPNRLFAFAWSSSSHVLVVDLAYQAGRVRKRLKRSFLWLPKMSFPVCRTRLSFARET